MSLGCGGSHVQVLAELGAVAAVAVATFALLTFVKLVGARVRRNRTD